MNIYRINVKNELYFLAENTNSTFEYDYFYTTIKNAQKNIFSYSKGFVLRKNGMAMDNWEKFGIIRCKQLLEKYSDKPKEKKKKENENEFLTLDPYNYGTITCTTGTFTTSGTQTAEFGQNLEAFSHTSDYTESEAMRSAINSLSLRRN